MIRLKRGENMLDYDSNDLFQNSHGFWYSSDTRELSISHYLSRNAFKNLLNKSIPKEEKFIRISCIYSLENLFYNFKFKTPEQETYTCICTALGNTDDLWEFIEDICADNFDNSAFKSEQEGPESILLAQRVDSEKIRFTIFNDRWMKHYWNNEKKEYVFEARHTDDENLQIVLDVILNRKDFIYTFYLNLYQIFYGSEVEPEAASAEKAQTDSNIIKEYLGYTPATEKDYELKKLLEEGDLDKIESALKNGANPNAITETEEATGNREQILTETLQAVYVDRMYSPKVMGEEAQKLTDEELDKLEFELEPYKLELLEHNFEIIKLLFKYGARPISIFSAIYAYYASEKVDIVKYLLDNNCIYDTETIGFVCSDDQFEEGFTPEQERMFNRYYNMYDEYLFDRTYQINYDPTMPQRY